MQIRMLNSGDGVVLGRVAPGVFDHAVIPERAAEFLDDDRHHIAVAIDDGTVFGFASGVHYVHPDKEPKLWINEVGVAPTHRKQGLAARVVRALLDRGRELGCREAWVLTEPANAPARRLYQKTGGRESEEGTVMFDFRLDPPRR